MTHNFWVKRTVLPLYMVGKTLEVRLRCYLVCQVKIGDTVVFNNTLHRRVTDVRYYLSFRQMLDAEDYIKVIPTAGSPGDVLFALHSIYPYHMEKKGVVVWELGRMVD